MLRYLTRTLAAVIVSLLAFTGITPANADENTELEPVVVVMDYSSSMLEKDADKKGTSRIDAAKKATKNLIDNAPEGATMGLVVYGSKAPKQCDDITTIQKPGVVDKKKLKDELDDLKAVGETPIGASLLHAAKDLESVDGPKSIILVSDGEENCSEPPACEAAQDLAEKGINLTVHTIGFKVNDKARKQLECIAEATNGTYVDAADADSLQEELTVRTLRAFAGYQVAGTPIEGAAKMHEAPLITPGQYVDVLERGESKAFYSKDGSIKYYKLDPIEPGERLHFAATMIPDQTDPAGLSVDGFGGIRVQLLNGQGKECASGRGETARAIQLGQPMNAYAHSPKYDADTKAGCFADGTGQLYAAVTRSGELQKDRPMDVELLYVREPAVDDSLLGAEATEEENLATVDVTGAAEPVLGGSSFNDALPVESGSVYSDSALGGEGRYYKIHVGNGQRLSLRAESGPNSDSSVTNVRIEVFSSVRDNVNMQGDKQLYKDRSNSVITQSMRTAVDQSNRSGMYGQDAYLGGDYYVVVYSQTYSQQGNNVPFDYELAFEVTGEERPFGGEAPIFSAEPASADAPSTEPSETAAASAPASPSSSPAQPSQEPSPSPVAAAPTASSTPLWPWYLGGLVAAAALLGVGSFLLRHRATAVVEDAPTIPEGRND